jgi:membrane-associated protease RseP (regulator of RpoE activity)
VGGAIQSRRARLPEVILGHFLLHRVVAIVPESSLGALSDANIAGFIQAEILDRFTVTWDYAGKKMFLAPNHAFGTPFDTDCSGLHLVSPGPGYQKVFIDSVLPGSPGAMSGLKPNDEIVAVSGVDGLPLWQVSRALRQADTSVLIAVQRETRILKFTLPLRSPFSKTD